MMPQPFLAVKPRPTQPANAARLIALNLLVAALYAITGLGGLKLAFIDNVVTLFWPPSGIAFAAVWLGGARLVPGVMLGAFAVNAIQMADPEFAALVAVGNGLPALIATTVLRDAILRRSDGDGGGPGELWRVAWFIMVAALGATTVSATIGTLAVAASGVGTQPLSSAWLVWWMGDAMGVLIIAPPVLLWERYLRAPFDWRTVAEALAFAMAGLGIIAGLAFIDNPVWAVELCKLFTLLLSLWAGARFGLNGPAAMTLLMAAGGVGVTLHGVGPFKRDSFYDSFALLHSYLFAEAIAGMLLAAALGDLRRTAAAERRARADAEAASANRIRMLTMISHDVRTPLAGMMGALQTLERGPIPPDQAKLVGLGLRAGRTLTTLVTDILDVARADAGRIVLNPAPFDPGRSLTDIAEIAGRMAADKGLALTGTGFELLPALVNGDRARFEQIVGNLVTNAVAHTETGSVTVAAGWHRRALRPLVFEVGDTGPGIEPGRVPTLFDAFGLEPRPGNRSAGLGLGLHICRRLVDLMGGTLSYRAAPGGGSVFRVELPLPAAPRSIGPSPVADPPQRVLLVEDDPIAATVTEALLASRGHAVVSARDGEAALALVAAGGVDLVLVDISIGADRTGGMTAARQIRRLPGDAGLVPIVALTAHADTESHDAFIAAGMDGVLVKPLSIPDGLAAAVTEAAARRKDA